MLEWRDVSVHYDQDAPPVLTDVRLRVEEAELVLVAGRTGSGKSTLLRTLNGLVPRFTGGVLTGEVMVGDRRVRDVGPRELSDVVGFVGQDPAQTFVTEVVEDELAYGMEQLGLSPSTMRRRVEETLDLLGIADLRRRPVRTLSGGQQQRVAIGAVLTMHPRALVLDEPTSALDPTAAEEVLGTLARLVDDLGLTVLVAEHRMERVVPFADRLVLVEDGHVRAGDPAELLETSAVAPPVVELGRLAGWRPLPLTVRDARRRSRTFLEVLPGLPTPGSASARVVPSPTASPGPVLQARDLVVTYGRTVAVREVSIDANAGQVTALMGRNGSGKSSLLWALQGTGRRQSGSVTVGGVDPATTEQPARLVGLVPQTATDLLYLETVAAECETADRQAGADPGTCRTLLDELVTGVPADRHPRDLSEGQRLCLVLALVLTARPRVIALDEPTRGLDYEAKAHLARIVRRCLWRGEGHAVLTASHDVEFVAQVADEVVVLAGGETVSAGPTATVLAESPAFAPQTTKILGDGWLTVDQVREVVA